ncbi:hypothetical protein B0181_03695 [Moraxella caviae]|uniref:Uncharacterized protein n=1 Tax=Moraxella caviae TaxID=34060 RepID=A0A1T0A629_9GAMM|nr:hypothetical protein [Moraxella caviae]OOR91048.1 hypothetical protein B0181_03695 [Moraxella caviae]STZ14262.1 Uncharacterised protein [Moraxella caviae]VEW12915.1 Uncharacterised protein [Moraxella caviae]
MSRAIPHFLKTRNLYFHTKGDFRTHLDNIYQKAKSQGNQAITKDDEADLKDFIQDYCDKSEHLLEKFDLDNCHFIVAMSEYGTKCLFIVDNDSRKKEQISLKNFGAEQTPEQNFRLFCTEIIRDIKLEYRKILAEDSDLRYDEVDLWHEEPSTKELVDEFVQKHELSDILDKVISPNDLGNSKRFLMPDYEYLKQKFLDFYREKMTTNKLQTLLKERKPQ